MKIISSSIFLVLSLSCLSVATANVSLQFQAESFLRENKATEALNFVNAHALSKKADLLIRARAHYTLKEYSKSEDKFSSLLKLLKKPEASLLMRVAQLKLKLKKPSSALSFLSKVKGVSVKKELLVSQALWDSNKKEEAYSHLAKIPKRKLKDRDLIERQKLYYLFKLGRVKKLFDLSKDYLKSAGASVDFGLYGVSLLKKESRYLAELYFDQLISVMPKNDVVLKERGVFELESGNAYLASLFLDRAAHISDAHSFEAAAVHLDLGHHEQALFFNSKVSDQKKKALQQFTIYLDAENYEKALSLKFELKKRDLLKEDKVSYALMYSAFKVGDYSTFSSLLTQITSKNYLSKVLKLKEIVDSCKESVGLQCVFS